MFLGMTTNECFNRKRYVYTPNRLSGTTRSLFHRGFCQNLIDFTHIRCFGLFKPDNTDWMTNYDIKESV
jgi:hypothetical protein